MTQAKQDAPDRFWRGLGAVFVTSAVIGGVVAFGQLQYRRGFDTGADSAICAFAVGLDGQSAINTQEACRNIRNTDWIVEGFDPHGKDHSKGDAK